MPDQAPDCPERPLSAPSAAVCCGAVTARRNAVVVSSPAKLNVFLEVRERRPDGYHELDTVMVRTTLCDTLTVLPRLDHQLNLRFSDATPEPLRTGVPLDHNNLILRAASRLQQFSQTPGGADFILHKQIPPQSGLGGGSGNAAATLLACRAAWNLSVSDQQLHDIAATLGSDINFLLSGHRAAVCRGRGEQVFPVEVPSRLFFLAARPARGNSTPDVFRRTRIPESPVTSRNIVRCLADGDLHQLHQCCFNRLTAAACEANPEMQQLIASLSHVTGRTVIMSGSGSTVFLPCLSAQDAAHLQQIIRRKLHINVWNLEV
jgi:4-diphosphocytidyl-2-C-methyl-D-erythritol kinase